MKSLEKPRSEKGKSEKTEFAGAYKKEFEDRKEEKKNLFETHKDRKPSEAEEKQTELKDFAKGGKFEGRIEHDKEIRIKKQEAREEKVREGLKKLFAIKIGVEFYSFYRADDIIERMRKNLESDKRGEIKKSLTPDTGGESSIKKDVEKILKYVPSAKKRRETAMKKITEIENKFKGKGLSEEDIKEICNRVRKQEETDYMKEKEDEIKKELEKKTEKAKE